MIVRNHPRVRLTGIDISPEMIHAAREFASLYRLPLLFDVGEAEQLDFRKFSFDRVISTFGIVFSEDPMAVAAELGRVCKPGGRIVLTAWRPTAALSGLELAFRGGRELEDPLRETRFLWAQPQFVRELLGRNFQLRFQRGQSTVFGTDPQALWKLWARTMLRWPLSQASPAEQRTIRRLTEKFFGGYRVRGGVLFPRDYLLITGIRRGPPSDA
jgi:SAM-dependent methyltransferase